MRSARGWARLFVGAVAATATITVTACDEEDSAFSPLEDTAPPVVSITSVSQSADTLRLKVHAEDFIAVAMVVTELRRTDQFETIITAEGDTVVLGRLIAVDTAGLVGRVTSADVDVEFLLGFTQATDVDVRAIAVDAQGNEAVDVARITVGGGPGGGLGGPTVSITSPLPNQTVRDNTLIRVGVQASDPSGLAQLNVVLTGITPPTVPAADTIRFGQFRTDVDTLLDFFVPAGALGQLTITAEAINLNTISAFAQITVTVATEVPDDTVPPVVSMVVSGGVERRQDEPLRMEADDSLLIDVVASDQESAITRMGVTLVVRNDKPGGTVTQTIFQDSVFSPSVSGTVPVRFAVVPNQLPAAVFTDADVPDTLFFEVTAWAFDAASPTPNCGASVDPLGSANSLRCTTGDPVGALGVRGGQVDRLIVSGRTVGFPQGSLIADAVVDTLRELLLLSDFNFGVVRPFDLSNEIFLKNVPVGSNPWGLNIDLTQDRLLVSNSGGTNISVVHLGPRTPGAPSITGEVDRFQTQDLKVYRVLEDVDAGGERIFPVEFFEYSDRPQFLAQAANGLILYSTVPAAPDLPGTIREYDPEQREVRFFIAYADRKTPSVPEIQVINADSVFAANGARAFKICDHTRGDPSQAARSCVVAAETDTTSGLEEAVLLVAQKVLTDGWDVQIFSDLDIASIALQDTTFVAASGDREFIAFGEGDTPDRAGRIIMYRSETQSITNTLQVSDLPGNAEQKVFGLGLNNDGSLGVARGTFAYFFGPDQPGGPNVLRLVGINENIAPTGVGAVLHPDHDQFSVSNELERLAFLGAGDARIEMVDTYFFSFSRGQILIRDPIVGPLRVTRRLPGDPANVVVRLYGVTENGVVVIPVKDTDIIPIP
jgi:hypothetical protein